MVPGCDHRVTNGLTDVDHILRAFSNHVAAIHQPSKTEGGRGAAKSTATIPMLEEAITETQGAAWKHQFDRYCVSCKLSDKDIQNGIFETIPSNLVDQIKVNLSGRESKDEIFAKIKNAVVKKRSIFWYRYDFHELKQSWGEDPKRFAARIKQIAPAQTF